MTWPASALLARPATERMGLRLLATVASAVGAPRAAASARRLGDQAAGPAACAEFCTPVSGCPGGCGCPAGTSCFSCSGCGDVGVHRCFNHACSGFCWKMSC